MNEDLIAPVEQDLSEIEKLHRVITQVELDEMVFLHQRWEEDRTKGKRLELNCCQLLNLNLSRLRIDHAFITQCVIMHCNLSNIKLINGSFFGNKIIDSDLMSSCFNGTDLSCCRIKQSDLTESSFIGSNFNSASLYNNDCIRTNFSCSDFRNTNLIDNIWTDADLTGVIGNAETIFSASVMKIDLSWTKDLLYISGNWHTFEEWWKFNDDEIGQKIGNLYIPLWKKNKSFIKNTIDSSLYYSDFDGDKLNAEVLFDDNTRRIIRS